MPRAGPIPLAPTAQESCAFPGTPYLLDWKIRGYTADLGGGSEFKPYPRIARDPRQRDGVGTPPQAFWGNAPKPWRRADSFRPSMSNGPQVTKKRGRPTGRPLFLERVTRLELAPKAPGKLCFPGDPLPPGLENPRLHRGFGWRQRVQALPTHRQGPASAGRRGYAATSVLGQRPKTLAQGGFIPPEHVQWAAGHQKKRTSYRTSSFFGASDEARTRYLHLGKVALYQMSYTRISKRYIITLPQECQGEFSKVPKKFCGTEVVPSPQVRRISATRCWPLSG